MPLTLKILSFKGQPYAEAQEVIIDEKAAAIGRSKTNAMVLEDMDKIISRRHATVEFENGQYKLIDSSLAGTFIDDAIEPINNASVQLLDGMQIKIGDYIIVCSITDDITPFSPSIPADPFSIPSNDVFESHDVDEKRQENPFADIIMDDQVDNNELLHTTENELNNPSFVAEHEQDANEDLLISSETSHESDLLSGTENNALLDQLNPDSDSLASNVDNSLLDPAGEKGSQSDQGLLSENMSSLNDSFIPAEPVINNHGLEQGEMPDDFNFEDLFNMDGGESEQSTPPHALAEKSVVDEPVAKIIQEPQEIVESVPLSVTNDVNSLDKQSHTTESSRSSPIIEQARQSGKKTQVSIKENNLLLQAFLRGAQIKEKDVDFDNPEEKMTRIGTMFRQFTESTVSVLRNRAEFKSLFRVIVTTIKKSDNNPLKFAVTTDEAIKHLINNGQGGFKKSVESIDEGFNDLLNHQLAMQAGIQASLNDILRKFDPATIEKQYEEGIVLQKKSKCWDKYLQIHAHLSETAVDDFFGDAFSEAYEKQMKQLKK